MLISLSPSCTGGGWGCIWPKPIKILSKTSKYVKPHPFPLGTPAKGDGAQRAELPPVLSARGIAPAWCGGCVPCACRGAVLAEGRQGRRSQVVRCHLAGVGRMCRTSPRASALTSVCSWWRWKREEWLLPSSGHRAELGALFVGVGLKGRALPVPVLG